MLVGVLGSSFASPGHWKQSFKVGLGLDLSSGSEITLKALPPPGHKVSAAAINESVKIITDRVEATGFTGASVVPQGKDDIVVSVPGKDAEQVHNLVSSSAVLALRQVLAVADNYTTPATSTSPSASASPSPSSSATPSPTPTASAKSSAGSGQAASASLLAGQAAKPKASASPSSTPSPSASASSAPAGNKALATVANASGNTKALTPKTVKLFDQLNCADKNWEARTYGENTSAWDVPGEQTVACFDAGTASALKYALAPATVQGKDLSSVNAELDTSGQWQVVFDVKEPEATALGNLTTKMVDAAAPTNGLAVVLDGQLQGAPPAVQGVITTSGEINGGSSGFTQAQATSLANVLKYGSLPLSFTTLYISSVSPQLGSAQLSAGLIAAGIGLLLVVIYSFIYYRGLGVVSVSSLAISAMLTYLSVVLLSKYEGFTLSLAGVAGLIVAIGITADSFVVYFERLRDEVREGRSLRAAVERGWGRARRTILVSDTVSFLAALLLYILSIGDVRGFAFTLGLTTLIDIIVVFLFTKPMITLLARTKFYGQGHKLSGLDPERLGARAPWRGSRRPARPATGGGGAAASRTSTSTREA
jgi:preprotein translocase subunit SecD